MVIGLGRVFVAFQGDELAESALRMLAVMGVSTHIVEQEEDAVAFPHVVVLGWKEKQRQGLRHGFSGGHVRIPSEARIKREEIPRVFKGSKRVVFVRNCPMNGNKPPEALTIALYNMAIKLRWEV